MTNIVSLSGGKDSTAMVHVMLEAHIPIDTLLHFECDWDFPQMKDHLNLIEKKTGLRIVHVRYYRHFNEQLQVFGWPKSAGGWCIACKQHTCNKYIRYIKGEKTEFVGFTTDEKGRTQTNWMKDRKWPVRFPLIELGGGYSEKQALDYCYSLGYDWDGLYDVFDRIGCFCCPKGGKAKWRKVQMHYPELYKRWLVLDEIAAIDSEKIFEKREKVLDL